MPASHFDFVEVVAADWDLQMSDVDPHFCRLRPRQSELAWYCDIDDGTPTGESDPASSIRWVCPALGVRPTATGMAVPVVDVHRRGPQSDLGRILRGFGRVLNRGSRTTPEGDDDQRFVYTDRAGILDSDLRRRIENWPSASPSPDGMAPPELWSISCTKAGLVVLSVSWWGSAPALDHQLRLSVDIARRMTAQA